MIETDREITLEYNALKRNLTETEKNLKFLNFCKYSLVIIGFIYIIVLSKGISSFVTNIIILEIFILFFFFCTYVIFNIVYAYIESVISDLSDKKSSIEKEIENLQDFLAYITACRHIEAKEANIDIYPEVRYNDSIWIKEHYEDEFEEKRIEYEKQHIENLKLNPHYLDEKLTTAPIYTYPLHEQELLQKRKKELEKNNK